MPLDSHEASVFFPTSIEYAKSKAKHLRALVPDAKLSLAEAQQLTAKAMGHKDWHALDRAVKANTPPSPLTAALGPVEQQIRWNTQVDALYENDVLIMEDMEVLLPKWNLAGTSSLPKLPDTSVLERALEAAWPKDDSEIKREIRVAVSHFVQRKLGPLTESGALPSDVKKVTLRDILNLKVPEHPIEALRDYTEKDIDHAAALRESLLGERQAIRKVLSAAAIALRGTAEYHHRSRIADALKETLKDKLVPLALEHAELSLWELFFDNPQPDGLIFHRNTKSEFEFNDEDDEDDYDQEFPIKNRSLPAHPREILSKQLPQNLTASLRHQSVFSLFQDTFRITDVSVMLRTPNGDNVGFVDGQLIESANKAVSKWAFLELCDSQSQGDLELAESLLGTDVPNFTTCFKHGAFLDIDTLELAKDFRGRGYSAILVETLVEHCAKLAGSLGGICLDVCPSQFPWISYKNLPQVIRDEASRVSQKLDGLAQQLLARPSLQGIPVKCVRLNYPDNRAYQL
jgi:GNAT superfamily N-acetyltransferase